MVAAGNKAKALRRSTVPQKQFLLLIPEPQLLRISDNGSGWK